MNVDQVEVVRSCGVVQRARKSQRVRGMLEERILLHLHFVEEHPLVKMSQAERLGVGHEMDFDVVTVHHISPEPPYVG